MCKVAPVILHEVVFPDTAAEQRGNTLAGIQDLSLKAKAKILPGLSYMCRIGSVEDSHSGLQRDFMNKSHVNNRWALR